MGTHEAIPSTISDAHDNGGLLRSLGLLSSPDFPVQPDSPFPPDFSVPPDFQFPRPPSEASRPSKKCYLIPPLAFFPSPLSASQSSLGLPMTMLRPVCPPLGIGHACIA